jgi:hypothetical protein
MFETPITSRIEDRKKGAREEKAAIEVFRWGKSTVQAAI